MTETTVETSAAWPASLSQRPLLIFDRRAIEVRDALIRVEREQDEASAAASLAVPAAPERLYRVQDGVAIIPITGALTSRPGYFDIGYATSYGALVTQFTLAAEDPAVHAIVAAVSSSGGTVDGILEAAAAIRAARTQKRVSAVVNGIAASAAYWLAAQTDEIALTNDLALVGSIGVYTMHIDLSKLLTDVGLNVTLISSGRHKVEGNPFQPLPAEVRDRIQLEIDDLRLMFAREVALGRGNRLTSDLALQTEARVYRALNPRTGDREAITNKLADRMGSLNVVIGELARAPRRTNKGDLRMDVTNGVPAAQTPSNTADASAASREEGRAAGVIEGRQAERTRVSGILGHAEAAGREQLARHLAFETDMAVEAAATILAASPKAAAAAAPAAGSNRFDVNLSGLAVEKVDTAEDKRAASRAIWSKAVANANRRFDGSAQAG